MATPSPNTAFTFPGNFWQAPLVPVALAWTAGIVLDRHGQVGLAGALGLAVVSLGLWLWTSHRKDARLPLFFLWSTVGWAGAIHHHLTTQRVAANDISQFLTEEARPGRLRGQVDSEPNLVRGSPDSLRSLPVDDSTHFVLRVHDFQAGSWWQEISGWVQVNFPGRSSDLHVGDLVEIAGHLARPAETANPSDFDYAEYLRDQGIRAVLSAPTASAGVIVLERGWPRSLFGWLGSIRAWASSVLERTLPADQVGVAAALLLGDGSGMTGADWEKYLRTGVLHVLAISGQHLVVLAAFLGLVLRLGRMRRRPTALTITLILFGYALLTGGRPPVMRAAWAAAACCGGILFQRPVLPANTLALAWLGVALVHPTDIFNVGCQMSFLAVLVLLWGPGSWNYSTDDPLAQLVEETRPLPLTLCLKLGNWLLWFYVVNLVVWLAMVPLAAFRFHVVNPIAILIGPPVVLASSLALLTGFLLLVLAPLAWPLAKLFAWLTSWNLWACEGFVDFGTQVPGGHFFVSDLPNWWMVIFYGGLVLAFTVPGLRRRWPWTLGIGLAMWILAAWFWWGPRPHGEFRCTFLAVGHGGCIIIETPDGQNLLYDAGAITGPDVTRRHIAPFLWHRGINRLDEVVVSHADLDHFNGLPTLLDRFAVKQITTTPSFAERSTGAVRLTLEAIARRGIPLRQVQVGDHWQLGDVSLEVLHPPAHGPEGVENVRSLVLLVKHQGRSLLLTGDLQDEGLATVMNAPAPVIDVLMAPHHGSKISNTPDLAKWAKPKVVISCQRRPLRGNQQVNPYEALGIPFLGTWPQGAITITQEKEAWRVETFRTKKVVDIR